MAKKKKAKLSDSVKCEVCDEAVEGQRSASGNGGRQDMVTDREKLMIQPDILPRLVAFQGDLIGYGDSFASALIGEAIAEIADKRANWRPKTEGERNQEALIKRENEKYVREK